MLLNNTDLWSNKLANRERSNTADADQSASSKKAINLSVVANDNYHQQVSSQKLNETAQPKPDQKPIETSDQHVKVKKPDANKNTKAANNFDQSELEIHKDESIEDSLFISRTEEDEELVQILTERSHKDYDIITESESKLSMSYRGECQEEVKELYLGEPKWSKLFDSKATLWKKVIPHRVYKIKTVWQQAGKFDTEVTRRYRHFVWLRKMLLKEFED